MFDGNGYRVVDSTLFSKYPVFIPTTPVSRVGPVEVFYR